MFVTIFKWLVRSLSFVAIGLAMASCTMLGLNYSSLETQNKDVPSPALPADFDTDHVRTVLETELYGPWPGNLPFSMDQVRIVDANYLDGRGTLEEAMVTIGTGETARTFPVVIAYPAIASERPVPLIISQTFSDNCSVFPNDAVTARGDELCDGSNMTGFVGFLATQIFGTYIAEAPVERYLDAGLAYASFYGSSLVPDQKEAGPAVMQALQPGPAPTSTLMAWAYGFHATASLFGEDDRIRADAITAMGHSRYGKSGLIALAWSDKVAATLAHQSGFAGAASSRSTTGEGLERMARTYPHWLRPGLAGDLESGWQPTYDQHYLLALSAPKPMFLGNARRDVWSDPNSTYRIAQAADAAYEAAGVAGLVDEGMRAFHPQAEIAYWLRTGGHSVISEDIDVFITFTLAHFGADQD